MMIIDDNVVVVAAAAAAADDDDEEILIVKIKWFWLILILYNKYYCTKRIFLYENNEY